MHLTLKKEATKPAAFNFLQQQERFDEFIGVYNNRRPHQALGGAYPGDIYTPSPRIYEPPGEPEYPYHDRTIRVTRCGRICLGNAKSTSVPCLPAKPLAYARSMTKYGWSASWSMIWDTSIKKGTG